MALWVIIRCECPWWSDSWIGSGGPGAGGVAVRAAGAGLRSPRSHPWCSAPDSLCHLLLRALGPVAWRFWDHWCPWNRGCPGLGCRVGSCVRFGQHQPVGERASAQVPGALDLVTEFCPGLLPPLSAPAKEGMSHKPPLPDRASLGALGAVGILPWEGLTALCLA